MERGRSAWRRTPVGHAHSLSCSCSPLVSSLADQITLHFPSPPGFLRDCLPTILQARVLSRTAPRISYPWQTTLTTMMPIDLRGLSSPAPAPHRRFTHQYSFIASRIHVRAPGFSDSSHGPCRRRCQFMPLSTLARAH